MKTLLKIFPIVCVLLLGYTSQALAQLPTTTLKNSVWTIQKAISPIPTTAFSLDVTAYNLASQPLPASKVNEAFIQVIFDLKTPEKFLHKGYNYTLQYDLVAIGASTSPVCTGCKLTLRNDNVVTTATAENKVIINVGNLLFNATPNPVYLGVTEFKLQNMVVITNPVVVATPAPAIPPPALVQVLPSELQVKLELAVGYGVDVQNLMPDNTSHTINKKTVVLNWGSASPYIPNYEVEVLRLYNKDKSTITDEKNITTKIDWSKALRIETQSNTTNLRLTIAEGTGFYVWRVRPLGNYYPNGSGNAKNHGTWSYSPIIDIIANWDNSNLTVSGVGAPIAIPSTNFFYFDDPDNEINNIYSRTFTEGNRNKEVISYANGLQQSKQTQSYLPSVRNKVTVQTIYDHLGRPVITTLPVPTDAANNQGLEGYKNDFALNSNGKIYNPADFDTDAKINEPDALEPTVGGFDYYSGKNNVADAEGYPFTRTLYYNDGTGRLKEQSGVGKKHMIGKDANQKGKTVKTYYSTSAESELVRLFGKEAPDARSVLKTITKDQNGIASITYTSKEGKVIATCLSFTDGGNLLSLENEPANNQVVEDKLVNGEKNFNVMTANRRLAFDVPTPLTGLSYTLNCGAADIIKEFPCFSGKAMCDFEVQISIRKVDGVWDSVPPTIPPTTPPAVSPWTAVVNPGSTDILTIMASQPVSCTNRITRFASIMLPAGSYIIEKQLIYKGQVNTITDKSELELTPLANIVKNWLKLVTCSKKFDEFYKKITHLQEGLEAAGALNAAGVATPGPRRSDPTGAIVTFALLDIEYRTDLATAGVNTSTVSFFNKGHELRRDGVDAIVVGAACCKGLRILLGGISPFDCSDVKLVDVGANGKYLVNPFFDKIPSKTEFFPDFEGYAYAFYWDCVPRKQDSDIVDDIRNATPTNGIEGYPKTIYEPRLTDDLREFFPELNNKQYDALVGPIGDARKKARLDTIKYKVTYIYRKILKPQMMGWETPGTFNSMIYHMLTDVYTTDGITKDDKPVKTKPAPLTDECNQTIFPAFDNSTPPKYISTQAAFNTFLDGDVELIYNREKTTHYYCADLFKCWVNQLGFIKELAVAGGALKCPTGEKMDLQPAVPNKPSPRIREDGGAHDSQFNDHIKGGWLIKWLFGRKIKKLSQQIEQMQTPNLSQDAIDDGIEPRDRTVNVAGNYHLVSEFLNCTGYRFAKIITDYDSEPLQEDKDATYTYLTGTNALGAESKVRNYPVTPPTVTLPLTTYSGTPLVKYKPLDEWQVWVDRKQPGNVPSQQILRSLKNPIYAFKYFHYKEEEFPQTEVITCFADPNWKKYNNPATGTIQGVFLKTTGNSLSPTPDGNGVSYYNINTVKGTLEGLPATNPNELCEICGVGYVKCDVTYKMWSQGQRYTFFLLVNEAKKQEVDWTDPEASAKDFASVGYVRQDPNPDPNNPDPIRNFYLWKDDQTPLDYAAYRSIYNAGLMDPTTAKRFKTKVEIDIDALNQEKINICDQKRPEIRLMLLKELTDECYIIDDAYCKVALTASATANQIWEFNRHLTNADVNHLVDVLVEQCKKRGTITTYRRSTTGCRDLFVPIRIVDQASTSTPKALKWNLGFVNKFGIPINNITRVEYGVGTGNESQSTYSSEVYKRPVLLSGAMSGQPAGPSGIIPYSGSGATTMTTLIGGQVFPILDLTSVAGGNDTVEEFVPALHNYCEWNKRREVMEMSLKAKLKNMCDTDVVGTLACPTGDCVTMPSQPGQQGSPTQPYTGLPNPDVNTALDPATGLPFPNNGVPRRKSNNVKITAKIQVNAQGQETKTVTTP